MVRVRLVFVVALGVAGILAAGCDPDDRASRITAAEPAAAASAAGLSPAASPRPSAAKAGASGSSRQRRSGVQDLAAGIPAFPPRPYAQPVLLPRGPDQAALASRIPTPHKVAFLTVDDGWVKRPEAVELLRVANVPVTLFLTVDAIESNPGYFRELQRLGGVIEAHTISHRSLAGQSYEVQRQEICGSAHWLGTQYGRRPELFRPPYGEHDQTTLRAAEDCGMRAVLLWTETVNNGIVRYQSPEARVQPGDILLLHFRETFAADFLAALTAVAAAGLTPALLEDYVL